VSKSERERALRTRSRFARTIKRTDGIAGSRHIDENGEIAHTWQRAFAVTTSNRSQP
jgi:hypothetical protein